MRWRAPIIAVAALLVTAGSATRAYAQVDPASWQTVAGGDEIIVLRVDPNDANRLLAGTEGGGLVIWDLANQTFDQYLYPTQPGLGSNTIYDIAFGANDDVWLATATGVTHIANNTWVEYGPDDGLPTYRITSIGVQSDGTAWVGTYDHGMATLAPGAVTWRTVTANAAQPTEGPGSDQIADILVYNDGTDRVWVAHGRGGGGSQPALSVYDPASASWDQIYSSTDPTAGPIGDQIMALALDNNGTLWMGSWSKGVLSYDGQTWSQSRQSDGVCGSNVWAVAAGEAEVWAACGDDSGGGGVSQLAGGRWVTYAGADLPTDTIASIALASGTAYLGTNGPLDQGLGIVPFRYEALDRLTTAPFTPMSNDITAIAFDEDGTAWVGTRGAGLMRYDGVEWTVYTREGTSEDLVGDTITDLAVRGRELWIGATKTIPEGTGYADGGVSVLDLDTMAWSAPFRASGSATCDGLPDNEVSSLAIGNDADESVWIGIGIASGGPGYDRASHQGDGVAVYDPVEGSWACYTFETTGSGIGLMGNTVMDLATVGDSLWAATSYHTSAADLRKYGGGASEFLDGNWTGWGDDDEGLKTYSGPASRDPITGDMRSVRADDAGSVWMGTWDLDVGDLTNVWPFVDAVINERVTGAWLPTVFAGCGWVSAIVADEQGRLWAGTTRGHNSDRHDVEYSPAGGNRMDTAEGGIRVWDGSTWTKVLSPDSGATDAPPSGLASKAITALAVDPNTGAVWVGTENGGISIYEEGGVSPTRTPNPNQPTSTPKPTAGPTNPVVFTVAAPTTCPDCATATAIARPTDQPEPEPPPEVPEAGTLILLATGLAALAAWGVRRRL